MLYWATFRWHVSLGRVKYLIAVPLLAAMSHIRGIGAAGADPREDHENLD